MNRMQSLIITSHPGPSLAITALTTLLAAQAVRAAALVLLLAASALLLVGATRRWVAIPAVVAAVLLAVASARGKGKVPFFAAIGIAAVDVVLFALGGEALT